MLRQMVRMLMMMAVLVLIFQISGCGSPSEVSQEQNEVESTELAKKEMKIEKKTESTLATVIQKDAEEKVVEGTEKNDSTSTNTHAQVKEEEKPKEQTTQTSSQSTSQEQKTSQTETTKPKVTQKAPEPTVTIAIIGPKDRGTILGATKVSFKEGDTILDVLLKIAGAKKIHVDYTGKGSTAYVAGIDNFYEFDYGAKSGWTCKQNGGTLTKSAGATLVKEGDRIDWIYTEDYTEN